MVSQTIGRERRFGRAGLADERERIGARRVSAKVRPAAAVPRKSRRLM